MIAKILFTSGSTGTPKGVLNTHRMLSANQQMIRQAWPFLDGERPVIVDWLPWSHTFGGNHNVNMMLVNGGTIYVDGGRPAPGLFDQTVANLAEVPPTIYFNVPAGYAQLVPALEGDPEFAARFFSRLRLLFNAAAALPAALRARLEALAARHAPDRDIPVTGSWGATETAPAVTSANFPYPDARCIGAPLPGALVKLAPVEDAYEIRVQGPNVTPGYYARPDLTAEAFDAEGFYQTGDAVAFADPGDPDAGPGLPRPHRRGLQAEHRHVRPGRRGPHRPALRAARPVGRGDRGGGPGLRLRPRLAQPGRGPQAARPRPGAGRRRPGDRPGPAAAARRRARRVQREPRLGGPGRAAARPRPAGSLDAGEITDKGYLNQRKVLAERAAGLLHRPGPAGRGRPCRVKIKVTPALVRTEAADPPRRKRHCRGGPGRDYDGRRW